MKKLTWMVDGRRSQQWIHTAELLAKLHNVNCVNHRDKKEPAFFNLHEKAKKENPVPVRKLTWKEKVKGLRSRIVED